MLPAWSVGPSPLSWCWREGVPGPNRQALAWCPGSPMVTAPSPSCLPTCTPAPAFQPPQTCLFSPSSFRTVLSAEQGPSGLRQRRWRADSSLPATPSARTPEGLGPGKHKAGKAPTARGGNSRGQQQGGEEMVVRPSVKGFGQEERGSLQPLPWSAKVPG